MEQAEHLKQKMCILFYFYKTEPKNHNSIALSKTPTLLLKLTLNSKLFQKPPTSSYSQAVESLPALYFSISPFSLL